MAKFTVYDAFQLAWKTKWRHQKSHKDQHRNGMQAVEFFGKTKLLKNITTPDLIEYQQDLQKPRPHGRHGHKRNLQPGTVNKLMNACMVLFQVAARAGHIDNVPLRPEYLPEDNAKERVITHAEEDLFLKFFNKVGYDEEAHLFVVMIDTLARWSDVDRCRCKDVDLKRKEITYNSRKNKMISTLPLTDRAVIALAHLMEGKEPTETIYSSSYWSFLEAWDRAVAWMGLDEDHELTPHVTRHTGASRLAAKGISLPKIQGMGGWSSLKSVSRYMHFDTSALLSCRDALEAG